MGVNLGPRVGAIRRRMGCRPGVPDILILHPSGNGKYHGLAIELKVKGGHVSKEQEEFHKRLSENGYVSIIMKPVYEPIEALEVIQEGIGKYFDLK